MKINYVGETRLAKEEKNILGELGHIITDDSPDIVICGPSKVSDYEKFGGGLIVRISDFEDSKYEDFLVEFQKKRPFEIVRFSEAEQGKISGPIIRWSVDEDKFSGWTGELKSIITVADYRKIDFDLYGRSIEGLPAFILIDENCINLHKINLVFSPPTYCPLSFAQSIMTGCITVFYGQRWNGAQWMPPIYLENKIAGFYSDNLDEMKWILRKLLEKSIDELISMSYNSREIGKKLFSKQRNSKLWKQILQLM